MVGYEQDSRHGLWWLWCSPICGILSHSTTPYNHQPTELRVLQPLLLFHVEHERWQDRGHSHWPAEPAESGSWWVLGPISPFCWSNSACATWEAMVRYSAATPQHRNSNPVSQKWCAKACNETKTYLSWNLTKMVSTLQRVLHRKVARHITCQSQVESNSDLQNPASISSNIVFRQPWHTLTESPLSQMSRNLCHRLPRS